MGGPDIWIKRDDLTGLALGGNKTRKLEYILMDAMSQSCDTVITAGAAQSNHCRQTAAAAAHLQLECHLILGGDQPELENGNVLLDSLLGAKIHWAGDKRKGEDLVKLFDQLKSAGKKPYIIPYGGSNRLGTYAYVQAMYELQMQLDKLPDQSELSRIVFASSSGATHAGMILGRSLLDAPYLIHGIGIDKPGLSDQKLSDTIVRLANETSQFIRSDFRFCSDELILDQRFVGEGYGVVGELELEAIRLLAREEGIFLDPVYTGRALGGLLAQIRSGEISSDETVLFWHTGGVPALFAYADQF